MKTKYVKSAILSSFIAFLLVGCSQEDIPCFENQHNAVRFNSNEEYDQETEIYKGNFSFLDLPLDVQYGEYEFPLVLIGNVSTRNRTVNYEIVKEETTAPEGSYEIVEAQIPANSLTGFIKVKVYNNEAMKKGESYKLYLRLMESETLKLGPKEYLTATLNWDSNIIAPKATDRYLWITYNSLIKSSLPPTSTSSKSYSSNALKVIVAALDWDDWDDMSAHPELIQRPTYYTYKYLADYRLLNVDQSHTAYAAKLRDFIKKYKEEHPNTPLVHNDGSMKGTEIEARTY